MAARAAIIGAWAGREESFGRDQHVLASSFDCLSQYFFCQPVRVAVSRVEEIHACLETDICQPGCFGYVCRAPRLEEFSSASECSGSETQDRNIQARIA